MKLNILANFFIYSVLVVNISTLKAADGMPQFNSATFPSQLFWLVISFSLLYLVVSFIILPRIRENIRLRSNKISNDLERAEGIKKDIEKMKQEYDLNIVEAKRKAQEIVKKALDKSNAEYVNNIEVIKKQIEKKYADTEEKLSLYKKDIEKDIINSTTSLTASIVGKILNKDVTINEIEKSLKKSSSKEH